MKAFLFSLCYNILYTVGWLVTLPSYLLKQKRRGGFGTGLLERFGLYRVSYNREPKGVLYVHAVSVGEVVLALKFLRACSGNAEVPPCWLAVRLRGMLRQ